MPKACQDYSKSKLKGAENAEGMKILCHHFVVLLDSLNYFLQS